MAAGREMDRQFSRLLKYHASLAGRLALLHYNIVAIVVFTTAPIMLNLIIIFSNLCLCVCVCVCVCCKGIILSSNYQWQLSGNE